MASQEKFDLIVRARDEASTALRGITKNVVGMIAAFATVRTVTGFLKDSVTAAIESEAAFNDLGASIERRGGDWKAMEHATHSALSVMMRDLGLSDEALAQSQKMFIDYGANASQSLNLVAAAADLAAGKHMSLESATDMLAKAAAGNTIAFSRYGFELDKTAGSASALNQVLGWIEDKWGGAAQAKMQTAEGQLRALNEQYDELKESVGNLVIGPMTDLLSQMNTLMTVLNNLEGGWNKFLFAVRWIGSGGGANVAASFREWNDLMAESKVAAEALALKQKEAWDASMLLLGIGEAGPMSPLKEKVDAVVESVRMAKAEFQALDELEGYQTWKAEGGTPSKYSSELDFLEGLTDEQKRAQEEMKRFGEVTRDVLVNNIGDGISDIFLGMQDLRTGLQEIFSGIAQDFIRLVINAMVEAMATRLVSSIFNFVLPGSGLFFASTQTPIGANVPSGQRMAASAGGVTINLNGPIIGEEQYVRQVFVPILERDARLNMNRLSLRA